MSMLSVMSLHSQTYQQNTIELDSEIPKDKNLVFEASNSITLLDGFLCSPSIDNAVVLSVDRYGVFPPAEGFVGGSPSSNQDGVVGALPGELTVGDLGAAIYSIPILMPRGLGMMTPDLAVKYNSQAGNGLLGWGWNLSGLSAITRTGQTSYHDDNQSAVNFVDDRFLIDGNRLMLCSGTYGGNGAVYKTEIDEMSKIISFTEGYNGPARFVVHKKDGTVWEYGATYDSRVEPQNKNDVAMMWLLNKVTDPDGNSIVYNYYENQSTGESYILSIDYTLNDKVGIHTMYEVMFEYDDRDDIEIGYVYGNIVQKRKILKNIIVKNMMSGSILYNYSFSYLEPGNYSDDIRFMYYRLVSIGLTADGMKLNPTIINWNKKTHYSQCFQTYPLNKNVFNKVPFVGDFNGDGYSDVITVPYKLSNTYSTNIQAMVLLNNGDGSFNETPHFAFTFDKTLEWIYVVDFNGDGLDDVVSYYTNYDANSNWKSQMCVYINNGDGFTYIGEKKSDRYFSIYPGDFCAERKTSLFLKYNNEGYSSSMTPILVYYDNNKVMFQDLGTQACIYSSGRITVEDINGDGSSEIINQMSDKAAICALKHDNNHYVFQKLYYYNNLESDDFLFPGDFNGDGYTDFLKYGNRNYWEIVLSDGEKLKEPISCLNNNLLRGLTLAPQDRYLYSLQSLAIPSETIRTIDFDGDGKTDVGVFKSTGGNYYLEVGFNVYNSAGNSYGFKDIKRYNLYINHSHQFVHIGNFLGHENVSILGSVRSNPGTNENPKIVSLNPNSSKFSVERITDGFGNSQGFAYEYLMPNNNSFYEYNYQWIGNDIRTVALPFKALCADTTYSTNNIPCVHKYNYKNAKYHVKGHGLLGVERMQSKLLINNVVKETNVLENDVEPMSKHCIMLPKIKSTYNSINNLKCREEYGYNKCQSLQNDKVIMPLLTIKKTLNYNSDKAGGLIKSIIENIEYQTDVDDEHYWDIVNVGSSLVGCDENYTGDDAVLCDYQTETDFEYENNPSDWVVSRLKSVMTIKRDNNGNVGFCDIYDYYGSNPYQVSRKTTLPNTNMNHADPLKTVTEYSYDVVGHIKEQSVTSPSDKNRRVTKMEYGPKYNYRYPTSNINENGWECTYAYDNDYGNVVSVMDYNNFETESHADPLEITVEKSLPDGMKNIKAKRWSEGNKHAPQNASYLIWDKTSGNAEKYSFYSKNGKILREVTFGLNSEAIYVDMTYDDLGNMVSKSMPYKAGDDLNNIYYVYDRDNRLVQEVYPNGVVKYYQYDGLQTTINTTSSDGESHMVVETSNAAGWKIRTVDIGGNIISYEYYSDGKLKNAMINSDPATKVEYVYDNRRNVAKIKDLSYGETLYEYNAYGELKEKKTANNAVTTYDYDNMGNLIGRVETDAKTGKSVATQWVYDNKKGKVGMLTKIIHGDSQIIYYNYDDLLRMTDVTEVINGNEYVTNYTYDKANRDVLITYPSGVTIQKKYSNTGYYYAMTDVYNNTTLWQTDDVDAMGYITDYHYGNGLATHKTLDDKTAVLTGILTSSKDAVYQDLSYSYDDFGNLTSRAKYDNKQLIECFVYDNFNRLEKIMLNNSLTGVLDYDTFGNIHSKTNDGNELYYEAQYESASPYAVTKVKTDMPDFAGMIQSIDYTPFDKMAFVCSGSNSLAIEYGYDYSRIHSVGIVNGDLSEKYYVSDCEFVTENDKKYVNTYLNGPAGVFAVYRNNGECNGEVFYINKDHLDSWCLITDEDGNIIQRTSYDAWGNPRNDNSWSGYYDGKLLCDRGFTGHEHLLAFGIINMNGRAYDPVMSMMMSPDSYIQNLDFSQNFNRYIYCYNNPLSYCDPSGESVEWLLYGIFNGIVNVVYNLDCIDTFQEGALAFGAGFISGCLTEGLSGSSWAWQVIGNVAGKTLQAGTNSFVKQNTGHDLDWSILESKTFETDLKYALGENIAKSVLNAYINQPTDTDAGKSLGSILCSNKYEQQILATTTGKIAGNLFAGKYIFNGLSVSKSNWKSLAPYFKCIMGLPVNGIEFEGHSEVLGNAFSKLMNFDFSGVMNKWGSDMNYCYTQFRSLFIKNGS